MFFLYFRKLDLMLFNIEDVQIFLQYNLQNPFLTEGRPGMNPVHTAMHLWFKQTNKQTTYLCWLGTWVSSLLLLALNSYI